VAIYLKGYKQYLPSIFENEIISEIEKTSCTIGKLSLQTDSEFYPKRSDLKIMREDTKAAIVEIQELIRSVGLTEGELKKASLFVSNGAFVDSVNKYFKKIPQILKDHLGEGEMSKKNYDIYRTSPPLVALETLNNSTMSFIAQYSGIGGNNLTFGNTSISTYYAIEKAFSSIVNGDSNHVFVSASNCAGSYSFLGNSAVTGYRENWKESNAGGHLLFTGFEQESICKISKVLSSKSAPKLGNQTIERNWAQLLPEEKSDLLIHSGAFNAFTNQKDQKYCELFHHNVVSLFEGYGNLGVASLLIGITYAIQKLSDTIQVIDIVDRDVYGRESLIRVEKC
jgi:hypothetical protein